MKNIFTFLTVLITAITVTPGFSQINLEWSKYFNSSVNYSEEARSVCLDDSLNVYVGGTRKIVKYNPAGNLVWSAYFPNGGLVNKILYVSNNIYAAGNIGLIKITTNGLITSVSPSNGNFLNLQKDEANFFYAVCNENSGNISTLSKLPKPF